MSEKTRPALTPEEWERVPDGPLMCTWWVQQDMDKDAHRAAALALHGQPFGFTWEDVDLIQAAAETGEAVSNFGGEPDPRYLDLADRIAALLPPREDP